MPLKMSSIIIFHYQFRLAWQCVTEYLKVSLLANKLSCRLAILLIIIKQFRKLWS